jgi:hypothetical protein
MGQAQIDIQPCGYRGTTRLYRVVVHITHTNHKVTGRIFNQVETTWRAPLDACMDLVDWTSEVMQKMGILMTAGPTLSDFYESEGGAQ